MLENSIRERGVSFKQALNEAIRAGLTRGNRAKCVLCRSPSTLGWLPISAGTKPCPRPMRWKTRNSPVRWRCANDPVDANLTIYAVNRDSPLHAEAKSWWETAIGGAETVGLSWVVLLAFLRLMTRPNLKEHGVAVRMLRSANAGKILCQDEYQIVVEEWKKL